MSDAPGRWVAKPRFALNLVFFSAEQLPMEVLDQILAGGAAACARAGVAVVGGHSVRDPEVKFGLSVTGEVDPQKLWSNRIRRRLRSHTLVLNRPRSAHIRILGNRAIKKGVASDIADAPR